MKILNSNKMLKQVAKLFFVDNYIINENEIEKIIDNKIIKITLKNKEFRLFINGNSCGSINNNEYDAKLNLIRSKCFEEKDVPNIVAFFERVYKGLFPFF